MAPATRSPSFRERQHAVNSAYGRAVAHLDGYRVVNLVRSERSAADLTDAQGPVIVDGPDLRERLLAATDGVEPTLALDAVGGSSTGYLADTLATGSTVVTYGLLLGEPCVIDAHNVVFRQILLSGFWLPRACTTTPPQVLQEIADRARALAASGVAAVPIVHRYGLDVVAQAFEHASRGGSNGKIVR